MFKFILFFNLSLSRFLLHYLHTSIFHPHQILLVYNPEYFIFMLCLLVSAGWACHPLLRIRISLPGFQKTFGATNTSTSAQTGSARVSNLYPYIHPGFAVTGEVFIHAFSAVCEHVLDTLTIKMHSTHSRSAMILLIRNPLSRFCFLLNIPVKGFTR